MTTTATDSTALKTRVANTENPKPAATSGNEKPSPAALVRHAIDRQSQAFRQVLPKQVDPDRFSRLVLTAIKGAPDLMQAFTTEEGQTSVLLAAMQAAALGLEPNTPTQDCWLLPRRRQGVWECQLSIGFRGYLRLARRSGTIKTIAAEVVREGDHFRHGYGADGPILEWEPADSGRGELTHAWAKVWYHDGGVAQMTLNREQIEARRAMSDSWRNEKARPYSPWTKWPESMWRKSAIRALVPYLDLSAEVTAADDASFTLNDDGVIDVASGELELPPAGVNADTGEVADAA